MDFFDFVNKRMPGLFLLPIGTEDIVPGTILKLPKRNLRPLGTVWECLGELKGQYPSKLGNANMLYGQLSGTRKIKGGASLFGVISLGSDNSEEFEVSYAVTGMTGRVFDGLGQVSIQPKLNKLRKTNKEVWDVINDHLVVTECYYASDFQASFKSGGKSLTKATVERLVEGGLSGEVSREYTSTGTVTITKNVVVPFGVKGFGI